MELQKINNEECPYKSTINSGESIIITIMLTAAILFITWVFLSMSGHATTYREIKYKGHDMIEYYNKWTGQTMSVCHSPECKKCTAIYY